MISVDLENPAIADIVQRAADGDFCGAFELAKTAVADDPDNLSAVHLFARLDEISTTLWPASGGMEAGASGAQANGNVASGPAFACFQAEAMALLGHLTAAIEKLDTVARHVPLIQRPIMLLVELIGRLAPEDETRYGELLDVFTLMRRNDPDEVLGNYWLYDQRSPFNEIAEGERGRIFASSATYLPFAPGGVACWLPHLSEDDYLILTDWGDCSGMPPGFWKAFVPEPVRDRVWFLSNEADVHEKRLAAGFRTTIVNNNCWLDEKRFFILEGREKKYDAVYTGRAIDVKRLHLAEKVSSLALLHAGIKPKSAIPPAVGYERCTSLYHTDDYLNADQLSQLYNESRCGLVLSRTEGACYTVTEYMLCGIPVVSTVPEPGATLGGRQAWLSDDNCLYCLPTATAVAEAVERIIDTPFKPDDIRQTQVSRMQGYRRTFEQDVLLPLLDKIGYRQDMKTAMADTVWDSSGLQCKFRMENKLEPLRDILGAFLKRSIR